VKKHQLVDAGLRDAGLAAALANGDDLGGWVGESEDFVGDEVVREDDVGVLEEMEGAEGEKGWVAGPGAYEVDVARLGGCRPNFNRWNRLGLGTRSHFSLGLVKACWRA
jgi:hypothetical protein